MPVVRPAGVPTTNGHTSIHSPGVYEAILRKRCEQTDYLSMPEVLLVEDVAADASSSSSAAISACAASVFGAMPTAYRTAPDQRGFSRSACAWRSPDSAV